MPALLPTPLLLLGFTVAPSGVQFAAESELSTNGDLLSAVDMTASDDAAEALRTWVSTQAAGELFAAVQRSLTDAHPTAQLVSVRFANLEDIRQPFRLLFDYRISGFALVGERVLAFPLPAARPLLATGPLARWLAIGRASAPAAATNLAGHSLDGREQLRLPAGFRLTAPWSTTVNTSAGSLRVTINETNGTVELSYAVVAPAQRADAFSHPGLSALVAAIDQVAVQRFVAEQQGAPR